jgi:4-hydroxymandelate oxidase
MAAMDFAEWRDLALRAIPQLHWSYIQATADTAANADRDVAAWQHYDLIPAVLRGAGQPDATVVLPDSVHRGGATLRTPLLVSPTAAHGLVDPDGELATARAAAAHGVLMVYSNSATVGVTEFGRGATGPWWAQLYLQRDRARSWDYLDRARAAGAGAVVLTVDLAPAADAAFRRDVQARLTSIPGNFPDMTWAQMSASFASGLTTDDVSEVISRSGLPVHVKGVLDPADADRAVAAGAAGVVVSNHGRRQLGGVVPTADALPDIAATVGDRAFVTVDGGVRSGSDVVKALGLGARMVGIGRPILWALAADGSAGVSRVLDTMIAETVRAVAAMGVTRPGQLRREMVQPAR